MGGAALAIVQPGDLGDDDEAAPAQTTLPDAGTTTTTSEASETTTTTLAPETTTTETGGTATTTPGSGIGSEGTGNGGTEGVADTGAESMLAVGLGLLGAAMALRRLRAASASPVR